MKYLTVAVVAYVAGYLTAAVEGAVDVVRHRPTRPRWICEAPRALR